jgi:peptidoglycan-associated lipoprotein
MNMIRTSSLLAALVLCSCAAAPPPPLHPVRAMAPELPAAPEPEAPGAAPAPAPLTPIYFAYDSAVLDEVARRALDAQADALRRTDLRIVIEGHADERGTEEYNLALGEQRAAAVRKYLRQAGVDESRVVTVTFGEERPADPSSGEEAFARNRRAEIVAR